MLRSMTGFGAATARAGGEEVTVEVRAVNGKFCEVKARLPRELAALEPAVVRRVKERLSRGGIEVSVRRGTGAGGPAWPRVDVDLAARYLERFRELQERLNVPGAIEVSHLLAAEGVVGLEERPPDVEAAGEAVAQALHAALDALVAMREREGASLRADLAGRLDVVAGLVDRLAAATPAAVIDYRDRLARRVQELAGEIAVDPQRLAQEVAIFADRSDITEELTRLRSHLDQLRGLLDATEPVGRRLDFLLQEANREVNTSGSKSQWAEAAATVVELKAELERIREQIQNVE
jgi:uncharacterized protein (TIGR00255 family)